MLQEPMKMLELQNMGENLAKSDVCLIKHLEDIALCQVH